MRITGVVTRTGDGGETSLIGGKRVLKSSLRIVAVGEVDELNSLLGVILVKNPPAFLRNSVLRIQNELFLLGADLASPMEVEAPRIQARQVNRMEKEVEKALQRLLPLKEFILPGGGEVGSLLHVSRAVCRRAERAAVALSQSETLNPFVLPYLNRLSDWLFVYARLSNLHERIPEVSATFPKPPVRKRST